MIAEYVLTRYMRAYMQRPAGFLTQSEPGSIVPPKPDPASPLLLYVHVPFCEGLCEFCSFNRVTFEAPLARQYFQALRSEIRMYRDLGYNFSSVYVGGGTPTIAMGELSRTLELVKELWSIHEISTETNPTHLTKPILESLREIGIDRLSVGVQSFNDDVLREIGRYERYGSGDQILKHLEVARGYFSTLNVDMIFNYPTQTEAMLMEDVRTVKAVGANQITFYPLMSASAGRRNDTGETRKRGRRFYQLICRELLDTHHRSSAWCFSRSEAGVDHPSTAIDEYIVENEYYAGLGAGSFGYLQGSLYSNTFDIRKYASHLKEGNLPIGGRKEFSRFEQMRYYYLMKLFGGSLPVARIARPFRGRALLRLWKEIVFLGLAGAIRLEGGAIKLTERGFYLWLVMMREFFTGVNIYREQCRSEIRTGPTPPPGTISRYIAESTQ